MVKGPITLKPPYNFSELCQSGIILAGWHTHLTYDWRRLPSGEAPLSLYNAGRLWVTVCRESRLDHCWGNFGARFSEASAWALWARVLWENTRGQDLWHLPRPWKSPPGRLMLWDNGKLGLGQRSRMTERSPMGRLTLWDNRKLGLRCIDRGKKHDLGWPRSPMGRLTLWDNGKLGPGVQIWDGRCCERTLDELPTDGLRNTKVYVLYVYSTEPVLSAEL